MSWLAFGTAPGGTEGPYASDFRNTLAKVTDLFVEQVQTPLSHLPDDAHADIPLLKHLAAQVYQALSLMSTALVLSEIQAGLYEVNAKVPKVWEIMDKVQMTHPDPAEFKRLVDDMATWAELEYEERTKRRGSWLDLPARRVRIRIRRPLTPEELEKLKDEERSAGPVGAGPYPEHYDGPQQDRVEPETFRDKIYDDYDPQGYAFLPQFEANARCPYDGHEMVILQDAPDRMGCPFCRRQLAISDPKEQRAIRVQPNPERESVSTPNLPTEPRGQNPSYDPTMYPSQTGPDLGA
jgi:hypothetical protein